MIYQIKNALIMYSSNTDSFRRQTAGFIKSLLMLLIVLYGFQASATVYYFSQSAGLDANNGTSSTTPKKSIGAALPLMGSGNILKFKCGDQWYLPVHSLDMRNKSNFTIDSFGTGNLPLTVFTGFL
jgi:hypothetical protein